MCAIVAFDLQYQISRSKGQIMSFSASSKNNQLLIYFQIHMTKMHNHDLKRIYITSYVENVKDLYRKLSRKSSISP